MVDTVNFLSLLESEEQELREMDEYCLEFLLDSFEQGDDEFVTALKEMCDVTDEEVTSILEQMVKRVNAKGEIRKTLSRKIRSRRAALTTGISKSRLKIRARKAARTKRRAPMIQRKALRKRRKALRKRKQYGLK